MDEEEQLALIHIGIITKHFMPDGMLPDDLDSVAKTLYSNLQVNVASGDSVQDIRSLLIAAFVDKFDADDYDVNINYTEDAFDRAMKGI